MPLFNNSNYRFIPVDENTKRPKSKWLGKFKSNGEKKYEWKLDGREEFYSKDEIDAASALGIDHKESKIIDVDLDTIEAAQFGYWLPSTLSLASPSGKGKPTHYIYSYDGETHPCIYNSSSNKDDKYRIAEVLFNTQTVVKGKNRSIVNDLEPRSINKDEYDRIKQITGKIALAAQITKYYPEKESKLRDDYSMAYIGSLVRHTKWNDTEIETFIEDICNCDLVKDEEADKRKEKVNYFRECLKDDDKKKKVPGLASYAKFNGWTKTNKEGEEVGDAHKTGYWFNFVNPKYERNNTPIRTMKLSEFIQLKTEPKKWLAYPFLKHPSLVQIFGQEGKGKTLFTWALALHISQGIDFLHLKNHHKKRVPVLMIDAEMSEEDLIERATLFMHLMPKNSDFSYFNVASLGIQLNHDFDPLNYAKGQERVEMRLEQLATEYNEKPIIFLDNLTYLTEIQEKDGREMLPFMVWLIGLRSKGYTVVFVHHETKSTGTSSGSNVKDRPLDASLRITSPEEDERVGVSGTQLIIEYVKMRGHVQYSDKQKFIAACSDEGVWSHFAYVKKTKSMKALDYWLSEGKESWDESMKDHEEFSISKAQFYKTKKQIKRATPENNNPIGGAQNIKEDEVPF